MSAYDDFNVYKVNDCDWVAAKTLGEGLAFYQKEMGLSDWELFQDLGSVRLLGEPELANTTYVEFEADLYRTERTFAEELQRVKNGSRQEVGHEIGAPFIFASTEF